MHGKEFNQLAHSHLQAEFCANLPRTLQRNPCNLRKSLRLPFHYKQGVFSKMVDNSRGAFGANPLHHPTGQISKYLRCALWHHSIEEFCFKLLPVIGMRTPTACYHQLLPHHGKRDRPNNGDILSAPNIQAQNGVSIFIILVNHGADCTLKNFHFLISQNTSYFLIHMNPL